MDEATKVKVAEISGAAVDNKAKLELLKIEQAQIKLENAATEAEAAKPAEAAPVPAEQPAATTAAAAAQPQKQPVPAMRPEVITPSTQPEKDFAAEQLKKEQLVDKARVILTANEAKEIGDIIENLPTSSAKQVSLTNTAFYILNKALYTAFYIQYYIMDCLNLYNKSYELA